ncbi:MAG: hypothetical protein ABIS50_26230 [Luteolibacter sp.]|uniref:hypothetical protein n=1 Tax=Luteolibacter sp. TaxID=1962973 RepID=UPI00326639C4
MTLRYIIGLLGMFAVCFGAQSFALRVSGGKTVKSESNYFSSIARIQTESQGKPRIMMLGSSITGRLGDRAQHFDGVANLGCDGGSAVVTLRAMDRGILPTAALLIIEANSLSFELEGRGKEIGAALDSHWFDVGIKTPNLGATARPSAFAYSWLMARSSGSAPNNDQEFLPISTKPVTLDPSISPKLNSKETALVDEVVAILGRLRKDGSKILLVMLPPGAETDSEQMKIALGVAAKSGVPWWNLTEDLPPDSVGFSDGLHLDAASAQKVMLTLMREVRDR